MSTESTESVESAGQNEAENNGNSTPELPEWAQKELDRARKEAAKYRERSRQAAEETENKLKTEFSDREKELNSKIEELSEKYEDALMKSSESERSLTKLKLALEHGIPSENVEVFTKRLVGETPEELEEDAKNLAGYFGSSVKEDHSQGAGATPLNSPTLLTLFEKKFGKF